MKKCLVLLGILAVGCSTSAPVPPATPVSTAQGPTTPVVANVDLPADVGTIEGQVVLKLPGMV